MDPIATLSSPVQSVSAIEECKYLPFLMPESLNTALPNRNHPPTSTGKLKEN